MGFFITELNTMQRLAFKMKLNRGQKELYKKRHDELWQELKTLLKSGYPKDFWESTKNDLGTMLAPIFIVCGIVFGINFLYTS